MKDYIFNNIFYIAAILTRIFFLVSFIFVFFLLRLQSRAASRCSSVLPGVVTSLHRPLERTGRISPRPMVSL